MKNRISHTFPQIVTAVSAVFCILFFCLVCLIPGNHKYAYAPYSVFVMTPEERSEESIPDYGGKSFTYTSTVPDGAKTKHGARLSAPLIHTIAEVWLDGELQYTTGEQPGRHIGKTPGITG